MVLKYEDKTEVWQVQKACISLNNVLPQFVQNKYHITLKKNMKIQVDALLGLISVVIMLAVRFKYFDSQCIEDENHYKLNIYWNTVKKNNKIYDYVFRITT